MNTKFCYLCGGQLEEKGDHFLCTNCSQQIYLNPKPCVEVAIFNDEGQILLAKRAKNPAKGKFDIPGGFVDIEDGSLEEGLRREVSEELGIDFSEIKNVRYALSYSTNYPWGRDNYKNLIMTFVGTNNSQNIEAKDDVEELVWFYPEEISSDMLSFPELKGIISRLAEYNIKEVKHA